MQLKIIFVAIALVAVASAFTTRKLSTHNYRCLSQDSQNWYVEDVDRLAGTGSGQYTCDISTAICVIGTTTTTPSSDGLGNFFIPKTASDAVPSSGTLTLH